MIIKYKSLTDMSDKMSALPTDTYKKALQAAPAKKSGFSFKEERYVEKPNYDIPDDDDDSGMGMMAFYMFIQLMFVFYWSISYLSFNAYVQKNLPIDQRQRPSSIKFFKNRIPGVQHQQQESVTR